MLLFFVALGGATAGPGMALTTDNARADYGRGGPGFQIFPFMAIFSTNSTIYQSIRSFPKLALYGSQSYVKWGRPVMRSLILESPTCGGAVLEVHNRRLRKLNLVAQKFFIKKYFFTIYFHFHIKFYFGEPLGEKIFLFVNWKNFTFFYHILEGRMDASLFNLVSTLPDSRSRT